MRDCELLMRQTCESLRTVCFESDDGVRVSERRRVRENRASSVSVHGSGCGAEEVACDVRQE